LIPIKPRLADLGDRSSTNKSREEAMPFDAMVMSVAVLAVFVAFAVVLAWADGQTRPSQPKRTETAGTRTREANAPLLKHRSF
jgi:hypothetical protein